MDISTPPEDQELRNVIDKLAQFVARNGPEFEKMTMEKQKDNLKSSFLFGGEYFIVKGGGFVENDVFERGGA